MKYYTATIKNMYVKSVGVNEDVGRILTDSFILKENAPFFLNLLGRPISLEYNTYLPTINEANVYVTRAALSHPERPNCATCMYVDYDNMEVHEIKRSEYKKLKKVYRDMRNQKKSS